MAVRLRLRVSRDGFTREFVALLNSGYEADTPQLMIPVHMARDIGLWPPPPGSIEASFETYGGPIRVWIVRGGAMVSIVEENTETKAVECDIVISYAADEPLISDMLAGRLEVAVEDFAQGLWRFRWEPKEKVRKSHR